jgi:hypothetical protein
MKFTDVSEGTYSSTFRVKAKQIAIYFLLAGVLGLPLDPEDGSGINLRNVSKLPTVICLRT